MGGKGEGGVQGDAQDLRVALKGEGLIVDEDLRVSVELFVPWGEKRDR